jgi:hypothetical protein
MYVFPSLPLAHRLPSFFLVIPFSLLLRPHRRPSTRRLLFLLLLLSLRPSSTQLSPPAPSPVSTCPSFRSSLSLVVVDEAPLHRLSLLDLARRQPDLVGQRRPQVATASLSRCLLLSIMLEAGSGGLRRPQLVATSLSHRPSPSTTQARSPHHAADSFHGAPPPCRLQLLPTAPPARSFTTVPSTPAPPHG